MIVTIMCRKKEGKRRGDIKIYTPLSQSSAHSEGWRIRESIGKGFPGKEERSKQNFPNQEPRNGKISQPAPGEGKDFVSHVHSPKLLPMVFRIGSLKSVRSSHLPDSGYEGQGLPQLLCHQTKNFLCLTSSLPGPLELPLD